MSTPPRRPDGLRRAFPGEQRFATERIAEKYTAMWKEHADFLVDFHTGGDRFVQHPFVIFTITGSVPTARMESLARMFGVPTLWRDRTRCSSPISPSTCRRWAYRHSPRSRGWRRHGTPAGRATGGVRPEFPFAAWTSSRANPCDAEQFSVVEKYRIITPSRGGFFYPLVKPGDPVARARTCANRGRIRRRSRSPALPCEWSDRAGNPGVSCCRDWLLGGRARNPRAPVSRGDRNFFSYITPTARGSRDLQATLIGATACATPVDSKCKRSEFSERLTGREE